MGVFVFTFLDGNISIFYTVMSARFKDYEFGIDFFPDAASLFVYVFLHCIVGRLGVKHSEAEAPSPSKSGSV